jgi:polyribonucleotide nucleotidyltransferase
MIQKAIDTINVIVTDYTEGMLLTGTVISIKEFGAFLEFAPGKEGMVHISKISNERIKAVEDVLKIGDVVKVVCTGQDKMGRFNFSMKDVKQN